MYLNFGFVVTREYHTQYNATNEVRNDSVLYPRHVKTYYEPQHKNQNNKQI